MSGSEREQLDVRLSERADWTLFANIVRLIQDQCGGRLLQGFDGLDQRYWDFEIAGKQVTLHLEHFLGISLVASPDAAAVVRSVSELVQKAKEQAEQC